MGDPFELVGRYGLAIIFANVLFEQAGMPVPAVPTLVVAGALAVDGRLALPAVVAVAVAAAFVSDSLWYFAGRRWGTRVLKLLCRISLSPDACVRQTESTFGRWGALTLLFGKFVPGVSTVAQPVAGAMRMPWPRFAVFNVMGSVIWSSVAVALGALFHREIGELLARAEMLGAAAGAAVLVLLAVFIALKWWQRRRFYRMLRLARVSVQELRDMMGAGQSPIVIDVRSAAVRAADARYIPGAIAMDLEEVRRGGGRLPHQREIVFYCTCPNEASAAVAARQLIAMGFERVRPLRGGLDEWVAAGYDVETRSS
jgi:membrane protein DedA with SNARE-associated domain/rhodanese-related sulfurtransferase